MAKATRNAEATKAKIIQNAMLLFAKNGYDAATADEIAKASGVNKAMIFYYYKNKAGLYSAVMSDLFDAIYKEVGDSRKCCNSATAELRAFIETYSSYAQKHSYFPALLLRELSDSGAHVPEMMFASMRRLFALLNDILRKGEKEGVFKHSIPMVLHFMIIGTLNLLVTTEPLRRKAAEEDSTIDTCIECPMDEITEYIFTTIKTTLEVK